MLFSNQRGMSLIELIVAVLIAAILAAVAYPGYRAFVQRGWLSEGGDLLSTYAQRVERAYDTNGSYGAVGCLVAAPPPTDRWAVACALQGAGQGFLLTATGRGSVEGFEYTLDSASAQRTTLYSGRVVTKACWLVKGDDC